MLRDRVLGQGFLAAIVADLPATEIEREPGHRDVVPDVLRLEHARVRLNGDPLDELGIDPADGDRGDEPDGDRQSERPEDARERAADEEGRSDRRQAGQDVIGEELGVRVGVGDPGGDAPGAVDELELVELVAHGDRHEEEPGEHAEMDPHRRAEDGAAIERGDQVAGPGDHQ